jgi:hypothetical protein
MPGRTTSACTCSAHSAVAEQRKGAPSLAERDAVLLVSFARFQQVSEIGHGIAQWSSGSRTGRGRMSLVHGWMDELAVGGLLTHNYPAGSVTRKRIHHNHRRAALFQPERGVRLCLVAAHLDRIDADVHGSHIDTFVVADVIVGIRPLCKQSSARCTYVRSPL